jgi:hypothetical protein
MVNGRIDHDHSHPTHQNHLQVFRIWILKPVEIPEYLDKAVVYYIDRFIIPINVSEYNLQAIPIVFFIQKSLISGVVFHTTCNNVLQQFQ